MNNIGLKIMIVMFSVLALCIVSGCGPGARGPAGVDADPCMVEELDDGIYISCPESDVFIPYPSDDSDDVVYCKRGKGHKKHDHTKHEPCD